MPRDQLFYVCFLIGKKEIERMFEQYNSKLDRTILKIWSHCSVYEIECSRTKLYVPKFLCPRCGKVLLPGELALSSTSVLSWLNINKVNTKNADT